MRRLKVTNEIIKEKSILKNSPGDLMKAAQAWINKKLSSGVTKEELRSCVGIFSNRKKSIVMAEKGLTEKQYKKRYDFLAEVFSLL